MTQIIKLRDICKIGGILGIGKNKKEMRKDMEGKYTFKELIGVEP